MTYLKMALKTILISSGLPENRTIEQDPLSEVEDFPRKLELLELSSNPQKKKFPHICQDEKCNEKWPFLINRTMACFSMRDEL